MSTDDLDYLGVGPVYFSLRDVPDSEWPTGGFIACAELERLAAERRTTAEERSRWAEAINAATYECNIGRRALVSERERVERLQAVAVAALAYMESTSRYAGDDYHTTERRRPRMALDDSVAALQPGDLPGEVKEGL